MQHVRIYLCTLCADISAHTTCGYICVHHMWIYLHAPCADISACTMCGYIYTNLTWIYLHKPCVDISTHMPMIVCTHTIIDAQILHPRITIKFQIDVSKKTALYVGLSTLHGYIWMCIAWIYLDVYSTDISECALHGYIQTCMDISAHASDG